MSLTFHEKIWAPSTATAVRAWLIVHYVSDATSNLDDDVRKRINAHAFGAMRKSQLYAVYYHFRREIGR